MNECQQIDYKERSDEDCQILLISHTRETHYQKDRKEDRS